MPVNKELLTGTVPVNNFYLKKNVDIPFRKRLLTSTVPVNNFLLTGTVPVNKELLTGTVPVNNFYLFIISPDMYMYNTIDVSLVYSLFTSISDIMSSLSYPISGAINSLNVF